MCKRLRDFFICNADSEHIDRFFLRKLKPYREQNEHIIWAVLSFLQWNTRYLRVIARLNSIYETSLYRFRLNALKTRDANVIWPVRINNQNCRQIQ